MIKSKPAEGLFRLAVLLPFSVIAFYLLFLSGFSTAVIDIDEHSYLISDSFALNLAVTAAAAAAALFALRRFPWLAKLIARVNTDAEYSRRCRWRVLAVFAVCACALVIFVQKQPLADQRAVFSTAAAWRRGDFSSFRYGGYTQLYPNQCGLILALYLLFPIFGSGGFLIFQLSNVLALVLTYRALALLSDMAGYSRFTGLALTVCCALFLPAALYSTFVYGTLWGLCLAVNAIRRSMLFERGGAWHDLFASLAELFLAVALKNNYAIFAVGLALYLVLSLLRRPGWKRLAALLGAALVVTTCSRAVSALTELITGHESENSIPHSSWVAMGLSENDKLYDGWWDRSNVETLADAGYDAHSADLISTERIHYRLDAFKAYPLYAVRFFAGKLASQWASPDMQALWINAVCPGVLDTPASSALTLSAPAWARLMKLLSCAQFMLLSGVCLYIVLKRGKSDIYLLYCLITVGGFIFHTVWEAKAQYAMPYYVLLLPVSVSGYAALISLCCSWRSKEARIREKYAAALIAFIAAAGFIRSGVSPLLSDIFLRAEDTAQYAQYVSMHTRVRLTGDEYILSTPDGAQTLRVCASDAAAEAALDVSLGPDVRTGSVELIYSGSDRRFLIRLDTDGGGRCLGSAFVSDYWRTVWDSASIPVADGGSFVQAYEQGDAHAVRWFLRRTAQADVYCIMYDNNHALTRGDGGALVISEYDGSSAQQWRLIPADGAA